jgi:hypothetical protein
MARTSRSASARRGRGHLVRAALVTVVAVVGLLVVPGTASAAVGDRSITPLLDCIRQNSDGTYTAVIGYTNSARATEKIPLGTANRISPTRLQGVQPTSFKQGTQHGAFSVTVTGAEVAANARWEVDGNVLDYQDAWGVSSTCPPSTELPETGNGTGPAIALAFAGVIGAIAVRRVHRRSPAAAGAHAEDRDDA